MRTSVDFKKMAKRRLVGNYGNAAGGMLIMYAVEMVLMVPLFIILMIVSVLLADEQLWIVAIGIVIMAVVCMIAGITLMVGYVRLCYGIVAGDGGSMGDLLFAVHNHLSRFVGMLLMLSVFTIGINVVTFITAFIAGRLGHPVAGAVTGLILGMMAAILVMCRFTMSLFALIENPDMTVRDAMEFGKELIAGNLWRMVKLELSFIGIFILGYMTAGIGFIWIMPYVICTNILFYMTLKEEKYPPVYKTPEEEILEQRFNRQMPETPEYR